MLFLLFAITATASPIAEASLFARGADTTDSSYFNPLINGLSGGKCSVAIAPGANMIPCSRFTDDCVKGINAFNQVLGVPVACPNAASSLAPTDLKTAFASYASPFCNPIRTVTSTSTFTSTIKETITTLRPASTTTISKCTATATVTNAGAATTVTSTLTGAASIITSTVNGSPSTITQTINSPASCAPPVSGSSVTTYPAPSPTPGCDGTPWKQTQNFNNFTVGTASTGSQSLYVGGYQFAPSYHMGDPSSYMIVSDGQGGSAMRTYYSMSLWRCNGSESFYLKSFDLESVPAGGSVQVVCRLVGQGDQNIPFTVDTGAVSGSDRYNVGVKGPFSGCGFHFDNAVWHNWDNFVFSD